ncbi:hypothetical protein V6C03_01055 [Methyloligella sp. 2.7D]|uniref:hypothetical protein n=1 Tax=unclassified Methyloligella TaxID=2625955 RepID=UPI00157CA58F|nr:hypothetical protein [Methyloligella sp. GL2]QKP76750.1 hypothetical protein HT051_04360 [Methyloligella sp. GL2]
MESNSRTIAGAFAERLGPMVDQARTQQDLVFLAYLLGMALKEARRLAARDDN